MKQNSLFPVSLICLILFITGCKERNQSIETEDIGEQAIVTGTIKNRDHYPQVKELILQLPHFQGEGISYISPIADDNSFYFSFQPHAKICEVSIKPYIEHLYVQPGDSIHIEIDFMDLLNLNFNGKGAELNKQLTLYTEGGGFREKYIITLNEFKTDDELETILEREYQERWQRYQDFCEQQHPDELTKQYIEEVLLVDYYTTLFDLATDVMSYQKEDIDASRYMDKLPDAIKLFENNVITNSHFRLAHSIQQYITWSVNKTIGKDRRLGLEDVLAPIKGTPIEEYVFSLALIQSLKNGNDTIQIAVSSHTV